MANENGKTKYYALMEELKQAILSGQIKPGEKLPSENELSAVIKSVVTQSGKHCLF